MLDVSAAAARAGRDPETIRRWVRRGRLTAHRDGPRLLVDPDELSRLLVADALPLPAAWTPGADRPSPDWAAALRRSRGGRL